MPFLADHGLHESVVLPGSFYIAMAMAAEREFGGTVPNVLRSITFQNPVVLSFDDTLLKAEITEHDGGRVEYTFYEQATDADVSAIRLPRPVARLELYRGRIPAATPAVEAGFIERFQQQSQRVLNAERVYSKLKEHGNEYGPAFRKITTLWRSGNECMAKLRTAALPELAWSYHLDPTLLDGVTQTLASLVVEGKTFVLESIERVELHKPDLPDTLFVHASLFPELGSAEGFGGEIKVFDAQGENYLRLSGIVFKFLEGAASEEKPATRLVLASNFTAEPIEDSLDFWGDYFGVPLEIEFAPYNQLFQQLLDPGSAFRKNRSGVNVLLLRLEEWAPGARMTGASGEKCFNGHATCILPNGLQIAHLNQYETNYLYREIFQDQCYLKHGLTLRDGDTVLDIGANIGIFSLFIKDRWPNARVYAFEPAPAVYELLKANCEAHGSNLRPANLGVSDKPGTATFTFYEKSSVFSGFHSHESEDRLAIEAVVRNTLKREALAEGAAVEEYVSQFMVERLRHHRFECRLTSVSNIIRENGLEKIHLLKIDAEKSELEILRGIEEQDWPRIDQIVMEVHDPTRNALERVRAMLAARGFRCEVDAPGLLRDSGLFNVYARRLDLSGDTLSPSGNCAAGTETNCTGEAASNLEQEVSNFCHALRTFVAEATAPLVLCICPATPRRQAGTGLQTALQRAEAMLLAEAAQLPNVRAIGSEWVLRHYPAKDYYDPQAEEAGHIPYTAEGYAAIGTAVTRSIGSLRRSPYKVIALDCDNTLWKGIRAEDGWEGVEISEPHRRLQEFMLEQMRGGMLLCLCSKNNERDVLEVFENRADMVLKREHLVAWRINWNSKSESIKELAKELNLGLESFIFIDDNPIDCADVRLNCPGAVALVLPNPESFGAFLEHVWIFDRGGLTEEDQNRTRMYRENAERQKFHRQTFSLKEFINGLGLRIDMPEATEAQLARVSQLTFRTNQFNFTGIRFSETELRDLLGRENVKCLTIQVADRFGDYGLVGAVIYEAQADRYKVDTFLLSCRVLGRGVEHAVVACLAQNARSEGKQFLEFKFLATQRNQPVLDFISRLEPSPERSGTAWIFPVAPLTRLEYTPDDQAPNGGVAAENGRSAKFPSDCKSASGFDGLSGRFQRIGEDLREVPQVVQAIQQYRERSESMNASKDPATGTSLEKKLARIWRKVLGRGRIGLDENFFDVGGNSLRAVQLISLIKKELKTSLSIVTLFECPTIKLLSARLAAVAGKAPESRNNGFAELRGQQRRYNTVRARATQPLQTSEVGSPSH